MMIFPSKTALDESRVKVAAGGNFATDDVQSTEQLTVEEQLTIVNHCLTSLENVLFTSPLQIPPNVWYAALVNLKSFFARSSIVEYNIELVMFTSFLVATKTEEARMITTEGSLLAILTQAWGDAEIAKKRLPQVVALELPFLEGLLYNLELEKPFAIIELLKERRMEIDRAKKLEYSGGRSDASSIEKIPLELISRVARSDEVLYHSPKIIALGVFAAAGNDIEDLVVSVGSVVGQDNIITDGVPTPNGVSKVSVTQEEYVEIQRMAKVWAQEEEDESQVLPPIMKKLKGLMKRRKQKDAKDADENGDKPKKKAKVG